MTKEDLKHALISLILGIVTMAAMNLVNGLLHIFQQWLTTFASGTVTVTTYLSQTYRNIC